MEIDVMLHENLRWKESERIELCEDVFFVVMSKKDLDDKYTYANFIEDASGKLHAIKCHDALVIGSMLLRKG